MTDLFSLNDTQSVTNRHTLKNQAPTNPNTVQWVTNYSLISNLTYKGKPIRRAKLEDGTEVWVVIDVIGAVTGSKKPTQYWNTTKRRMIADGADGSTICSLITIKDALGRDQQTQVMTLPQLLRMLQSLPSKKAEPFRIFMAEAGYTLIKEAANPDLAIRRGMDRYKAIGMSEEQAKLRIRSVIHRKELTDKWASHGISAPREFALLTDRESKGVFGKTTGEMKHDRNLPACGNLRDKMTKPELAAQDVADVTISLLIDKHNPYGYAENCTEVDKGSAVGARLLADLQRTLES